MTKVFVNDIEVLVRRGSTALQACEAVGIEIPRFCYHERLSIAGNCRMCLVEVEKTPKPVASCAMPLMDGMKIYTDTPLVKKAREAVLEFLLLNHPLDCPICDQGGECDLQDQAVVFGSDRSRFYETKRSVEDKNCGPLVKTIMTRCIHCTRCVRFSTEIAGVEDLGTTGRGEDTEIGTYVGKALESELSGNVIDLCPVGALTSKPYAFTSRPWEIRNTNSIDTSDGIGSNTRIDFRGSEILRVLPRFNEEINEEWISDKARFMYDGLKRQRIGSAYQKKNDQISSTSWESSLNQVSSLFANTDPSKINFIAGGTSNIATLVIMKEFLNKLGVSNCSYNSNNSSTPDLSKDYIFNGTISDIENSDVCLIVNCNPRAEATLLNARLRKRYLQGGFEVAYIGPHANLTFPCTHIGTSLTSLEQIAEGKHTFCQTLVNAENPMILLGENSVGNDSLSDSIKSLTAKVNENLVVNGLKTPCSHVYSTVNQVGAFDLGLYRVPHTSPSLCYLLDTDDTNLENNLQGLSRKGSFWDDLLYKGWCTHKPNIIYQGHHGDISANSAGIILPGVASSEERSTFINIEGRAQQSNRVLKNPGSARENWKILKAIAGSSIPYCTYKELQDRSEKLVPASINLGRTLPTSVFGTLDSRLSYKNVTRDGSKLLRGKIDNFYTTNVVAKASRTMAECSLAFVKRLNFL
jgi:NADH dehydrogenase (ubiquinone) Fe-S protein 1